MFRKLYSLLFARISDAIEALEHGDAGRAETILIDAQLTAEQLYIEGTEE